MSATALQEIMRQKDVYRLGLMNSLLMEKQKKEKEKEEWQERLDAREQISFGLPTQTQSIEPGHMGGDDELLELIMIDQAADDIEQKIEAHRESVHEHHFDKSKPVGEGSTADRAWVHQAKVIASNDVFVALSHGRRIEIHRVADLMPAMKYDGREPWRYPSDILQKGNIMDIRYKAGVATMANVREQQQERQQEIGRQGGLSR